MATKRKRVRFTLDVTFPSEEAKETFLSRLSAVRDLVTPEGSAKVDNYGMLCSLFSLAEAHCKPTSSVESEPSTTTNTGFFLQCGGEWFVWT